MFEDCMDINSADLFSDLQSTSILSEKGEQIKVISIVLLVQQLLEDRENIVKDKELYERYYDLIHNFIPLFIINHK